MLTKKRSHQWTQKWTWWGFFKSTIFVDDDASKTLRLLVVGPNLNVPTWKRYDINNYSFNTESQDDKSLMQNSGVTVDADSNHFCSASDNNPIRASMPYFGVIEQTWELDYTEFRVPVFKCKWVNTNTGVHQDELGFTLIDLSKMAYMDETFHYGPTSKTSVLRRRSLRFKIFSDSTRKTKWFKWCTWWFNAWHLWDTTFLDKNA